LAGFAFGKVAGERSPPEQVLSLGFGDEPVLVQVLLGRLFDLGIGESQTTGPFFSPVGRFKLVARYNHPLV
jgi:hypothetical protein